MSEHRARSHHRARTRTLAGGAATAALLVAAALVAPAASATADHQHSKGGTPKGPLVVARGLDNPRQLSAGPGGTLLVAEAGHGGTACTGTGEQTQCTGDTAVISAITNPRWPGSKVVDLITGLPSGAGPDGTFAGGTSGVSYGPATRWGKERLSVVTNGAAPDSTGPVPSTVPMGSLLTYGRNHSGAITLKWSVDLLPYEIAHNPDGQVQLGPDGQPLDSLSNPYAALTLPKWTLVADAGANDILAVSRDGKTVRTLTTLPVITAGACATVPNNTADGSPGCDPVPTGITLGPDGFVYVSGLGSEVPGAGRVWKIDPRTGAIVKTYDGLTSASGVAVTKDGSVWVSELLVGSDDPTKSPAQWGQVTQIKRDGTRVVHAVPQPAGMAVVKGHLYVSAYSLFPATGGLGDPALSGQVWRLT
ncbi:MAG: ScyD/ScyE family protein [Actinomycetota bacterium]|nr:MAG: ScyD/ScyE family protein [Actinomycetota bacterium]